MRTVMVAMGVLGLAVSSAALAQGMQDFRLVNRTGYDIREVYVSPTSTDSWEEDVMGKDFFGNGTFVDINFHPATSACEYDLKVVYTDDEEAVWEDFDLCTITAITLFYDNKTRTTTAEYE
ncbi:hypothetical protein [Arenibaculum sp.]|jgi:hypothetical protein|uniref:hypothetical protein n=1 Tax=Arenibaculum sp. TaxID=2865862 RepID=UPI002E13123E|nr:hypothetical protein [Arenibaculum sp.]